MSTYCISEIGVNHDSDFDKAIRLIRASAEAGVDAVKFQIRTPRLAVPEAEWGVMRDTPWGERMTKLAYRERMEFNADELGTLQREARMCGVAMGVSVFDIPSLERERGLACPWIKIPSARAADLDLIVAAADHVARRGGEALVISTGGVDAEQARTAAVTAMARLDVATPKHLDRPELWLLHCHMAYPAPTRELNLMCIPTLTRWMLETFGPDGWRVGYCVAPDTMILRTDLRWIPASDMRPGEEIIAFDERLGQQNKMRRATITGTRTLRLPCYRIHTERGAIVASSEHKWVVSRKMSPHSTQWVRAWVQSKDVVPGDFLAHYVSPWEEERSFEAGWLAGIFDGEGFLATRKVCVAQNPGPILDRIERFLEVRGYSKYRRRTRKDRKCQTIEIGGRRESMRLLGSIRPMRLLNKADRLWEDLRSWSADSRARVEAVEYLGEQEVVGLKTSTGTLITNGFLSHNSGHEYGRSPTEWAVALGAQVIERHITLDRSSPGSDHASSLEPWAFRRLVEHVRTMDRGALGDGIKRVWDSERPVIVRLRGSIA